MAMIAIPPAGPNCLGDCMSYPYSDILMYYPRDYLWMYVIFFQLLAFLVFVIAAHFTASENRKIFSFIAVSLALISVTVLLADYFIQFSVVPISMVNGETEGIPLLTQYNGHGIFIVLEELGYILMSLVFLSLSAIYTGKTRIEKILRRIYIIPFACILPAFIYYSLKYGIDRDYRFEVAAITANWLVSIAAGILSSLYYHKEIKKSDIDPALKQD